MNAVINLAANLALGGAVALVLQRSQAVRRELMSWALLSIVGFEAVVFTPIATFLFRFYPQWSMLYVFDPQIFPELDSWIGMLSLLAVLLNFAAVIGGFWTTRRGLLAGKKWMIWAPMGAGGGIALLTVLLFARRVVFMGDYDAFWQGNADLFLARAAGWVGLLLYASGALFVAYLRSHFSDHDPKLV
jgi:hypothetical protein